MENRIKIEFNEGIEIIDFGRKFNNSLEKVMFPKSQKIYLPFYYNLLLSNVKLPPNFEELH